MSRIRRLILSFLVTLAVWAAFSWPLPRYVGTGIPSSAANVEKNQVRRMFSGDHLQLLYSYWLFADMFYGHTPFFHNVYEFNTGNDEERVCSSTDDLPFTLVFSVFYGLWGRALAWNLTGLLALWVTFHLTWLLTRRYVDGEFLSALAALLAIALPYRTNVLFGGSPTGYAMTWIPLLLWGLDSAVRYGSIGGGIAAAVAVLFSYWNDSHVFFFGLLAVPCWVVIAFLAGGNFRLRDPAWWRKHAIALLPAALVVVVLVIYGSIRSGQVSEAMGISERPLSEVALFSPTPDGLFAWKGFGHAGTIYIGWIVPLLIVAGLLAQFRRVLVSRAREWRGAVVLVLLVVCAACVVILALGPFGPFDGGLFLTARRLISPYAMMRQPAKIFCVLPPLLAVAAAVSLQGLAISFRRPHVIRTAAAVLALLFLIEYKAHVRPTICLLDETQAAYAAVADDARAAGKLPRAVVIPIWPGDSAWGSLYEHYVSLYRIRMLNGYQPVPPAGYIQDVFFPLEDVNVGELTDAQIDGFRNQGIDYLLFHEDAFPEQVSCFAAAFTLKSFLDHPRLEFMSQGENVWAFRLLAEPRAQVTPATPWTLFFPNVNASREFEWFANDGAPSLEDPDASDGFFAQLASPQAAVTVDAFKHWQGPDPTLIVRLRGHGKGRVAFSFSDGSTATESFTSDSDAWHWTSIPFVLPGDHGTMGLAFSVTEGAIDLDRLIHTFGRLPEPAAGESFTLPGPLFFHAGYTDLATDSIVLRAEYEPADEIFYGPKLPLAPGTYAVRMVFETDAPAGTELGRLFARAGATDAVPAAVLAGSPAVITFSVDAAAPPLEIAFRFTRNGDLRIQSLEFTRTR